MRRLLLCSLAFLASACGSPTAPTPSASPARTVVARVGATAITSDLFELRLHSTLTSVAAGGGPTNDAVMVGNVRASVLRSLLIDTVIAQEAQAAGVAATAAQVQAQVSAAASAAGGMAKLQSQLASLGGSVAQLEDASRSSLNEQHLEEVFAHQRALEVEQALSAGQDFAVLAAKYSDDTSTAAKGGTLGPLTRGTLASGDAVYAKAVLALPIGGHTDPPIRDSAGYDIVQVLGASAATITLRHIIVNAPQPYTVRERPQWFSLALFEALASDCASGQITIYISNVGDDPCAAAASPSAGVSPSSAVSAAPSR